MNVFILEYDKYGRIDWIKSAESHDNYRVPKMVLESAQLCSTTINLLSNKVSAPYRTTHQNHPCAIWARESRTNFENLVTYGLALSVEFTRRFGKIHKSQKVIETCHALSKDVDFPSNLFTRPACAISDKSLIDNNDVVGSYRRYWVTKKNMCYPKDKIPDWFIEMRNIPYEVI